MLELAHVYGPVTRLALSRASVDPAYAKLDLMDKEAVEGFFANNVVDGGSSSWSRTMKLIDS
jgi:L-rhamnose isomerase